MYIIKKGKLMKEQHKNSDIQYTQKPGAYLEIVIKYCSLFYCACATFYYHYVFLQQLLIHTHVYIYGLGELQLQNRWHLH